MNRYLVSPQRERPNKLREQILSTRTVAHPVCYPALTGMKIRKYGKKGMRKATLEKILEIKERKC